MESEKITVRDWVEAMRDGTHTHGGGALRNATIYTRTKLDKERHCALGVLCDIAELEPHGHSCYLDSKGNVLGGYSMGEFHSRLNAAGIDPRRVANINDRSLSYDNVIEYITCKSGADPDAVLYEKPKVKPGLLSRFVQWRASFRLI